MPDKLVIGLLGGIGSGKSSVATELAKHGARIIHADQLGHEALRQSDIRQRMLERWGKDILDEQGEIVRGRVGRIVFASDVERRALEGVVHPYITRRIREEISAAKADPGIKLVVLDAAIMLEAGWNELCDWLVYVHAPRDVRLCRVAEGRGWTAKEVEARERAQISLTEKATRADCAVDNSEAPELMARQVADLVRRWGIESTNRGSSNRG